MCATGPSVVHTRNADSSGDRWDRFDTYVEGVRAHLDDLAALRGLVGPGDVGLA